MKETPIPRMETSPTPHDTSEATDTSTNTGTSPDDLHSNHATDGRSADKPTSSEIDDAFARGYLKGLNENAAQIMRQPDDGEEPYPEGQYGKPITPDPFFIPNAYSVWD